MDFENIQKNPSKEEELGTNCESRSEASAVEAALLAGAPTQLPETIAQDETTSPVLESPVATQIENPEASAKRSAISYSEHLRGQRLPADVGDTQEAYEQALAKAKSEGLDFRTEQERTMDTNVNHVKDALKTNELFDTTRGQLKNGLDSILKSTGQDPSPTIQAVGDIIIENTIESLNRKLSAKFQDSIIRNMSPDDRAAMSFLRDPRYTGNMMFVKELGSGKTWKLEVGADPGTLGGKLNPRVGVTFRMKLPD